MLIQAKQTFGGTVFFPPGNYIISANGSDFTAGAISIVVHYATIVAPRS